MPIAAASDAFAQHLRQRLEEAGDLESWSVEARSLREAPAVSTNTVALVLWRIQPDEPAGNPDSSLRDTSKGDPPEGGGLRLRYLLLVRGKTAAAEQKMLGCCMAALHRNPVITGGNAGGLSPEALVVAVETPPDETYLRLAASCGDPAPLLVGYTIRSVPLMPPAAGRVPDPSDSGAS